LPHHRDRPISSSHSCVRTIEEALRGLIPSPHSIHVSIPSQRVTIYHPTTLSYLAITEAIEEAGFDVTDGTRATLVRTSGTPDFRTHSRHTEKHLEQCHVCQHKFVTEPESLELTQPMSSRRNLSQKPASEAHIPDEAVSDGTDHSRNLPHRLTLSVGGMTCGSCTIAITQALSGVPGVHDISVSLLSNSATAILDNKVTVADVLETLENIGYEAEIASLHPLNLGPATVDMPVGGPFRVTLSVGGMTCATCPSTVVRLLSEQEGVTRVSANLSGNSATLVVESKELIPVVQDVIECAGFEASVVSVEPVEIAPKAKEIARGQRTVALYIEDMFCE
jgi:Cu+-exporting ATPase